jgi:hypothetical protein
VNPAHFGTDRLEAVPVSAMAAEPGFRALLGGDRDRAVALGAVEAQGMLRDPYRPLPRQASPDALRGGATTFLLAPESGWCRSAHASEI